MEKKINIAELLKDCPKGMELDCTMFENVTFEGLKQDEYPIIVKLKEPSMILLLTKNGGWNKYNSAKCVIFPKGKTTWEGFVPPCQFKDGDIVVSEDDEEFQLFLLKHLTHSEDDNDYDGYCYFGWDFQCNELFEEGTWGFNRLATEEEKQKLFDTIKAKGYKWNEETKTLEKLIVPKFKVGDIVCDDKRVYRIYDIDDTHYKSTYIQKGKSLCCFFPIHTQDRYRNVNCHFWVGDRIKTIHSPHQYVITGITDTHYTLEEVEDKFKYTEPIVKDKDWELVPDKFDISTLKPFDKVLCRHLKSHKWEATFFSYLDEDVHSHCYKFVSTNGSYPQMIPYEGNEHLLGTTDDCDEFYKNW